MLQIHRHVRCAKALSVRAALLTALAQQHWHMSQTAVVLGVSRNTLYRKLRKYGIARQLQTSC